MSLPPAKLATLVERAYDPTLIALGVMPPLDDLGLRPVADLWGHDLDGPSCFGFLANGADAFDFYLAIRGTARILEWLVDAMIEYRVNPWGPGKVHRGFADLASEMGFGRSMERMEDSIPSLATLTICGHSLGGAAARQLSMRFKRVGSVVTWGEPRSTDHTAAAYAISCCGTNSRNVNDRDLVPKIPVVDFSHLFDLYAPVGTGTSLGSWGSTIASAHDMDGYVLAENEIANAA